MRKVFFSTEHVFYWKLSFSFTATSRSWNFIILTTIWVFLRSSRVFILRRKLVQKLRIFLFFLFLIWKKIFSRSFVEKTKSENKFARWEGKKTESLFPTVSPSALISIVLGIWNCARLGFYLIFLSKQKRKKKNFLKTFKSNFVFSSSKVNSNIKKTWENPGKMSQNYFRFDEKRFDGFRKIFTFSPYFLVESRTKGLFGFLVGSIGIDFSLKLFPTRKNWLKK